MSYCGYSDCDIEAPHAHGTQGAAPSMNPIQWVPVDVSKLRAQLAEAVEVLKLVEWGAPDYPNYEPRCPACRGFKPVGPNEAQYRPGIQVGHAPDCRLAKVIAG